MGELLKRVKRLDGWVNHVDTAEPSVHDHWLLPIAGCILTVFLLVFSIVLCCKYCKNRSKKTTRFTSQPFIVPNRGDQDTQNGLLRKNGSHVEI